VNRAAAFVALLAALALPAAARAAAPNYILVSGPGLARPIVLGDWNENLKLLLAVANAPTVTAGLRGRPKLDLAEFWAWSGRPRPTRPRDANQHGSLYPAHGGRRAVIVLTVAGGSAPRAVTAAVRSILVRHGVPLRR
jgi:hypothetical protein